MSFLQYYLASGVIESGIVQDGGPQCYAEIPKDYHLIVASLMALLHIFFIHKWQDQLRSKTDFQQLKPRSFLQTTVGVLSVITLALTSYYKISTRKGLFVFNPCHITLLGVIVLVLAPKNSKFMQNLHTYWTSWLYGAILAFSAPHLEGISSFQIFLYYIEHLLIFPIGPLILNRRYGFVKPTFINQIVSFSSFTLYQLLFLFPLSLMSTVNLNFVLCHTPADPTFKYIKHHYFIVAIGLLNIFAYLGRMICYLMVEVFEKVTRKK